MALTDSLSPNVKPVTDSMLNGNRLTEVWTATWGEDSGGSDWKFESTRCGLGPACQALHALFSSSEGRVLVALLPLWAWGGGSSHTGGRRRGSARCSLVGTHCEVTCGNTSSVKHLEI